MESHESLENCIELNLDGTIAGWGEKAVDLYGYTASDAIGRSFSHLCSAGPLSDAAGAFTQAISGRAVVDSEAIHRTSDGRFVNVVVSMTPQTNGNGAVEAVSVAVRPSASDESSLADEQRLWTWAAVETAVEAIITIDSRGIVAYANPSAEKLFGYSCEELIGTTINTLMPSPYREEHDGYVQAYLDTGKKKIIGIGREVVGLRKDGSVFPMRLAVSEVQIGDRRLFTGFVHDTSAENEAKVEKDRLLQELNKRNREINCLYQIGEAIRPGELDGAALERAANIIDSAISHPARAGTRVTVDGTSYESHDFQETPWTITADIVVGGRPRGIVQVYFLQDERAVRESDSLESERTLVEAVTALISEAMERTEAEAKVIHASKLASVGELAAGVGHEINNPVNGIINCADIILKEAGDNETVSKFAELIRSESDRIATIVHNLLTFSRQEREHHSLASIRDVVEAVLSLCNRRLEKSNIHLKVSVPEDLPRIYCRSEQLQQVLMNLVINGMHALDERFPGVDSDKVLRITAAHRNDDGRDMLRITVEDHGTGIPDGNLQRMFDPFFTTKGRDKGTGLGLSISDGIVKDHGGSMECETKLGSFTRFHVDLPVSPVGDTVTERSQQALRGNSGDE